MVFNPINTLKIIYLYDYIKLKPTTVQEIEHYNYLFSMGLIKFDSKFNLLSLTEKGINYLKENNEI